MEHNPNPSMPQSATLLIVSTNPQIEHTVRECTQSWNPLPTIERIADSARAVMQVMMIRPHLVLLDDHSLTPNAHMLSSMMTRHDPSIDVYTLKTPNADAPSFAPDGALHWGDAPRLLQWWFANRGQALAASKGQLSR